jgi:hypothetical protein
VVLTESGMQAVDLALADRLARERAILAGLDARQRTMLAGLLRTLALDLRPWA